MCDRAGWLAGGGAIIGIAAPVLSCSDRLATAALPATSLGWGASLLAAGGALLWLAWQARRQRDALERAIAERSAALRHSEALRDSMLENLEDTIVLWDERARIRYLSPAAERMFGARPAEWVGRPFKELLATRHHAAYDGLVADVQRGESTGRLGRLLRLSGRRSDGSEFPLEVLASLRPVGPGLLVGVLRDVSDRDSADEAMRRSELLRSLIDALPDAVLVVRDDHVIYANRRLLAGLGLAGYRDLLGRGLRELVSSADWGPLQEALAQVSESGKPASVSHARLTGAENASLALELRIVPLRFEGQPALVAIGRDLGERQRAERLFRQAVESSPSGMVMTGAGGRIVLVNRVVQDLFGYMEAELLDQPIEILVPERYRREHPALRAAFAAKPVQRAMGAGRELFGLRKDGREIPVEIGLNPIESGDGVLVLCSIVEISERRRIERMIATADRLTAVGTLAAGVAHGINNPLSYVKANVFVVREELAGLRDAGVQPADGRSLPFDELLLALAQAEEGTDRIRDIVGDLLTFSRKQDGFRHEGVDLNEVLDSVIQMTTNEVRHRARLVRSIGAIPPVLGDGSRLALAFTNLVMNAAQAIPEGRAAEHEIGVSSFLDPNGRVAVEIRDTGGGIPQEILGRIFEPFFTTKSVGSGTGLGLSITHGIVSEMGGSISVESAPGVGTTFRVLLPIAEGTQLRNDVAEPGVAPAPTRRARVLVVDDELLLLESLERVLSRAHEVACASTAREALERLRSGERFDVILCDLMMPDITGAEFYGELQRLDPAAAERVVFMTGGAFTPTAVEFLGAVTGPRLLKPLDPAKLRETIEEVLSRASAPAEQPAGGGSG
jgi:PAS domain S-box-containing protein